MVPWWLLVKESASFSEWGCDGLLPRGHMHMDAELVVDTSL